ncbi:CBS domain-containing protein [Qaidamihabitans albus]|uniref:CBS domain-containing protein n=1 Tax=Qaidamihabitans albus TaxID=2795733 RepID=UPI0018F1AA8B|nr:CBS domain-containing protein [Qaidamihabitans albus]
MAQLVRELMTADPEVLPRDAPVRQAAQRMRDRGIGDVLVVDDGRLCGVVTDRDIVVRALAERDDLSGTELREVCSEQLITASPNEEAGNAIARMREHAIRRVAVVDEGRPVGVFSIGDAAIERDPRSALSDISAAPANT